jgi:hypothetical protein
MTLKRLTLITATLLIASTGFGCNSHSKTSTSNDMVRFGAMDSNRNPLAMGAGDRLGVSLYRTHDLN